MKVLLSIVMLFLMMEMTIAQESRKSTVIIKTSAVCNLCKVRLEDKLNYTSGIKFAELNLEDKNLTVKFNLKKISLDDIRKIISQTGYDADRITANPESVENLPACCRPGGMGK
jgi:copper chaperone CopZ